MSHSNPVGLSLHEWRRGPSGLNPDPRLQQIQDLTEKWERDRAEREVVAALAEN